MVSLICVASRNSCGIVRVIWPFSLPLHYANQCWLYNWLFSLNCLIHPSLNKYGVTFKIAPFKRTTHESCHSPTLSFDMWRIWQYMMYLSKVVLLSDTLRIRCVTDTQIPSPSFKLTLIFGETGTELISSTFKICFFLEW